MYTHTHTHTHIYTRMRLRACVSVCPCACICMQLPICLFEWVYVAVSHVCVYVCMLVCMCMGMCISLCMCVGMCFCGYPCVAVLHTRLRYIMDRLQTDGLTHIDDRALFRAICKHRVKQREMCVFGSITAHSKPTLTN